MASWQPTVRGTRAVCKILAAVLSAHGDALPHGGWDAAVQRVRWAVRQLCTTLHAACCCAAPDILCIMAGDHVHMPHESFPFLPLQRPAAAISAGVSMA